jgi:VWFA-related protein
MQYPHARLGAALALLALLALGAGGVRAQTQDPQQGDPQKFRFRTGVELINVTATVTDGNGRFVSGLKKDDFRVYQDEEPQQITHFNSERVPVSLGIVLDTSGSMDGDKMVAARRALDRFLFDLLDRDDEVFLYRFDSNPELVQGWTSDMRHVSEALGRLRAAGGTALYDAVAEAVPMAQSGRHRKKALVVISDGNDTSSRMDVHSLKALIRESEVLVYAIGIDANVDTFPTPRSRLGGLLSQIAGVQQTRPRPFPFPIPGRRPRPTPTPPRGPTYPPGYPPTKPPTAPPPANPRGIPGGRSGVNDRVNIAALRDITDDSGGRTEIVRTAYDLGPATAGIADELSKQYYLGYPASGVRDGRWHTIRVEVRGSHYIVRARRGFVATP